MQKGYNSDIKYQGQTYHIQTEDWGIDNPFLVSKIFCNGAVIQNIKTPYSKFLPGPAEYSAKLVQDALKYQHKKILDLLVSGQLIKK